MITRRELLSSSIAAAGIGAAAPSWLLRAVRAQEQAAADPKAATQPDSRILVVVLLAGGNDGLNTVVPYSDERYREARPTLRIEKDKVLRIDEHVGLHPSMKLLRERYEKGEVAVLQNVGYPKPNRSHFVSMDIWQTADPGGTPRTGWLGRYADGADAAGTSPALLVHLGSAVPLALRRDRAPILTMDNEDSLSLSPDRKYPADQSEQTLAFRKLCERVVPLGTTPVTYTDVVRETTASGLASADEVAACLKKAKNEAAYPKSLGNRLSLVAKLIAGGMKTRVYFTSLGGFDTHARQRDAHANLLQNFSEAVDAFYKDLAAMGRAKDVLLMSFSEFGRRTAENASGGTDHGAAGPVFVVGGAVKGGLFGSNPDFEHLVDGDVGHSIDFRSVYATLMKDWLGADPALAVPAEFTPLELVQTA